jgi:hypothetical protein
MADTFRECENCGSSHDGSYGSGRFCGEKCARGFSTRENRGEINLKIALSLKGRTIGGNQFQTGFDPRRYKYQCSNCKGWWRKKDKQGYCAHVLHCKDEVPKEVRIPFTLETRHRGHDTVRARIAGASWEKAPRAERYRRVLREQGSVCGYCGLSSWWCNRELVLEIHHVDGNHGNEQRENLVYLCPNCHSQTPNYCRVGGNGKRARLKP